MKYGFSDIVRIFDKSNEFDEVIRSVSQQGQDTRIHGLWGSSMALFSLSLQQKLSVNLVFVTDNEDSLIRFYDDITSFYNAMRERTELTFFSTPPQDKKANLSVMEYLLAGNSSVCIVTTLEAMQEKIMAPDRFRNLCVQLKNGESFSRNILLKTLVSGGYSRCAMVEGPGEFSVRGSIIDIYVPSRNIPVRIEFFGDTVESMREFEIVNQRSVRQLSEVKILPACVSSRSNNVNMSRYLPNATVYIFNDMDVPDVEAIKGLHCIKRIFHVPFSSQGVIDLSSQPVQGFSRDISMLNSALCEWSAQNRDIIIVCDNEGQKQRLIELLDEMHFRGSCDVVVGNISHGFSLPSLNLTLVTDEDIFSRYMHQRHLRTSRVMQGIPISTFEDLIKGDYVVHENYGIGRYDGINRLQIQKYQQDFLCITYTGEDKLYVPVDQLDLLQKYIGTEGYKPKLYRLGGTSWQRVKSRIRQSCQKMARQLIKLYADREITPGYAFSEDTQWQKEFESSFIYEETPDQKYSITEVKQDMQKDKPMDRLVCGDVGYGKTEVAMRAAFKAVTDSKQVVVLAPTTVLAQQHLNTFIERFADYPVNIKMLSRFVASSSQKKILSELNRGSIDIVIGTHRLFQKDIEFKDLGLIIIDEEQKFGVTHKEKLKHKWRMVDVLTLSATPIPRTLQMALTGIRKMSVLNTPPAGRLSIASYVMGYDEDIIKQAILHELDRDGQVFYVHNRVKSIARVANRIQDMFPRAAVGVAHGQMHEKHLEKIMLEFVSGKYNILVSTTIIESGLDMQKVNTLIVEDASRMGLSQLYQLKGRVGRGSRKAYAYFFYPKDILLSDIAKRRLQSISEFSELGSGYKLAMRDLQIRGAGNMLGPQQSGYMDEVGFSMFCKILSEEVKSVRGEQIIPEISPKISMDINAYIPVDYITDTQQRVVMYKKLAQIDNAEQITDVQDELNDRYGRLPKEVELIIGIIRIRLLAKKLRIISIKQHGQDMSIQFSNDAHISHDKLMRLVQLYKQNVRFDQQERFSVFFSRIDVKNALKYIRNILQVLL